MGVAAAGGLEVFSSPGCGRVSAWAGGQSGEEPVRHPRLVAALSPRMSDLASKFSVVGGVV